MTVNSKVTRWLDEQGAQYEVIEHDRVYDAQAQARSLGVDVNHIAKSLVTHVTHHGDPVVLVVPGGQRISKVKIHEFFGTHHSRLALEDEMSRDFPDFELGAVPPLSGLLGLDGYIDRRLVGHDTVIFNAGSHTASIKMSMHDFLNIGELSIVDVVDDREAA